MANRIKGITIEIGSDTVGLQKALSDVNSKSVSLQKELKDVERLLKFNPGNVEAVAQKQRILTDQVAATTEKLNKLKEAEKQVQQQFSQGNISEEQYRGFRREIEFTEGSLNSLKNKLANVEIEQNKMKQSTKQLESLFKATGTSVDDFSNSLGVKLTNAIKNGTANSHQLEQAIKKIGQESLGTNIDLDKLKQALSKLDGNSNLSSVRKDLRKLGQEAKQAEQDVKGLGIELENVAGALAAGGGIAGTIEKAFDTTTLNTKIDVSFNIPEESKAAVKDAVRGIEAYGIDAQAALEGVRRQWALNADASDKTNSKITQGAAAIASAFDGIDFTELIQETNEIASELKISDEQALALTNSLLKAGFPPEQLDTIAEYGQQLQRAGYNAEEIQAIMKAGVDTGTWNIDNLLDGLKEGRIRISEFGEEMPKALAELLDGTNISAESVNQWGQAIAKGGEDGKRAMVEVATALNEVDDETIKNALGVQFFGTMYEDQGQNVIDTILNAKDATVSMKENQDDLNKTISDMDSSPAVKFQQAVVDVKTASEPLLSVIANIVGAVAGWMSENPKLASTITAIVTVIGVLLGIAVALAPIITTVTTAVGLMGVSFSAIVAPIGIAIAAIVGIIALAALIISNWTPIKEFFNGLWDGIVEIFKAAGGTLVEFLTENWKTILIVITGPIGMLVNLIITHWEQILNITSTVFDNVKNVVANIFEGIKNVISNIVSFIVNKITTDWNMLKSITSTVFNAIKSVGTTIFNGLKTNITTVVNTIKNIVSTVWNVLSSMTSTIFNSIVNTASIIWNNLKNVIMRPVSFIKNSVVQAFEGIASAIAGVWNGAVGTIKRGLNAIIRLINSFISKVNKMKIPDWVPGVGGGGVSIPKIPMLAKGTDYFKGGVAIVGEQGPELVEMPRGSKVYPNNKTMDMLSGNGTTIIVQNMNVRDDNDIVKISRELDSISSRSRRFKGGR